MTKQMTVPGWLVFAGTTLVASIFGVGTVSLLIIGRSIPEQLWMIDTAISVAYFGAGPFSLAAQHMAQTASALLDTVNHSTDVLHTAIRTMTTVPSPTNTPGSTMHEVAS